MPLQSRAAQGFAGAAVKIDLTLKGIKTLVVGSDLLDFLLRENRPDSQRD